MFGLFKRKKEEASEPAAPADTTVVEAEVEDEALDGPVAEMIAEEDKNDSFVPPPGMSGIPSGIPGFDYSPVDPNEEFKATAGKPLEAGSEVAAEDAVVAALRTVYDPEIPVNIYDLGLIYGLDIADSGDIKIDMTLTAPGCPVAGEMPGMVARAVEEVEGTGEIEVTLVWEPQWTPERMSEDAKLALGID